MGTHSLAQNHQRLSYSLLGLLLVLLGYLGMVSLLGNTSPLLVVRGVSMEPTYGNGDLLLSKRVAPADIQVGDVVAFRPPPADRAKLHLPAMVAHRVVQVEMEDGHLVFRTKGDNATIDAFTVPSEAVNGRVVKNLGPLGLPIILLTSRSMWMFILLPIAAFGVVFLGVAYWPKDKSEEVEGNEGEPNPMGTTGQVRLWLDQWVKQMMDEPDSSQEERPSKETGERG